MSDTDRPVYHLTLRSEPGQAAPVEVRLRRALKCLLRTFGFRCVGIMDVTHRSPAEARAACAGWPAPQQSSA
jgi:hypothetical protein